MPSVSPKLDAYLLIVVYPFSDATSGGGTSVDILSSPSPSLKGREPLICWPARRRSPLTSSLHPFNAADFNKPTLIRSFSLLIELLFEQLLLPDAVIPHSFVCFRSRSHLTQHSFNSNSTTTVAKNRSCLPLLSELHLVFQRSAPRRGPKNCSTASY